MKHCRIFICIAVFFSLTAVAQTPSTAPSPVPPGGEDPLTTRVDELRFEDVRLDRAIDVVREKTQTNIVLDWVTLRKCNCPKDAKVTLHIRNVTLRSALGAILAAAEFDDESHQVGIYSEDNVITVGDSVKTFPPTHVTIFDVHDLIDAEIARKLAAISGANASGGPGSNLFGPGPSSPGQELAELCDLVMKCVDRDSWIDNGGASGSLHYWGGRLFFMGSPGLRDRVAAFLQQLRTSGRPNVAATQASTHPQ